MLFKYNKLNCDNKPWLASLLMNCKMSLRLSCNSKILDNFSQNFKNYSLIKQQQQYMYVYISEAIIIIYFVSDGFLFFR